MILSIVKKKRFIFLLHVSWIVFKFLSFARTKIELLLFLNGFLKGKLLQLYWFEE